MNWGRWPLSYLNYYCSYIISCPVSVFCHAMWISVAVDLNKAMCETLSQFLDERELLKTPSEQERLLNQVPKVVAEVVELKVASRDSDSDKQRSPCSPQSILVWNPKTPTTWIGKLKLVIEILLIGKDQDNKVKASWLLKVQDGFFFFFFKYTMLRTVT